MKLHDDLLTNLAYKYGYIHDITDSTYKFNYYDFDPSSTHNLLRWINDHGEYENKLKQVDYDTMISYVSLIKEFNLIEAKEELKYLESINASFYVLVDEDIIKGIVIKEANLGESIYVSYLAILPEYRKSNASALLINSLKSFNKDILLGVFNPNLIHFYNKFNFEVVDKLYFS